MVDYWLLAYKIKRQETKTIPRKREELNVEQNYNFIF